MNRRKLLVMITCALFSLFLVATAVPFSKALSPNIAAENNDILIVDMPLLKPGVPVALKAGGRRFFLLSPTAAQLNDLHVMDAHVWHPDYGNWSPDVQMFAYWAESTRFGAILQEKAVDQALRDRFNDRLQPWHGGYMNEWDDMSYDYAGRTIKDGDYTYYGMGLDFPNMHKVALEKLNDHQLLVHLHGAF